MAFTYGRYSVFSKIEAGRLSIMTGLDQYLMDIEVVCNPHNLPQGALVIDDLRLAVAFGDEKIGVARPSANSDSFIALRQLKNGQQQEVRHFELSLSRSALEALENLRNGSDAIFNLTMLGNITGYATAKTEQNEKGQDIPWSENVLLNAEPSWIFKPVTGLQERLVLMVPKSDWVKLLDKAGYQTTVLVEIEVADSDALGAALKHVNDARTAFLEGRYADTVAGCRTALESAISDKNFCPWGETTNKGSRENMSVEARFRLSWCAIRHVTHTAHHSNGMKAEFTRPMAQYVLHASYLALSLLSKERDLFVTPEPSTSP